MISNRSFASLTFRKPQPDMTGLTVGIAFVNSEAFKLAISKSKFPWKPRSIFGHQRPYNDAPSVGNLAEGDKKGSPHSAQKKCSL